MTKINGRRLNGEGAISKHPDRDLWHGKVRVNGKRIDVYGKGRGEVRDKIRDAKRMAEAGIAPTKKETVAQYLVRWHDKDTTLRHKSIHSRKLNIARMTPHIGGLTRESNRRVSAHVADRVARALRRKTGNG